MTNQEIQIEWDFILIESKRINCSFFDIIKKELFFTLQILLSGIGSNLKNDKFNCFIYYYTKEQYLSLNS
jgi:hypothetical protein